MEMVIQHRIIHLQLLDRRAERVLPPQPPGDPSECPVDPFRGPVAPQPVLPDHLLDYHRHRMRDRYLMTAQVFIDPSDELIQPSGAVTVPACRQKMVIQDINDDAGKASSRPADELPARREDIVRVCKKIGLPVIADPLDDLAGESALHIALDEIGDEIPQHGSRGVVGTDHMGEVIHRLTGE